MVVVGGADEAVIGDVHQLPQVLDPLGTLHDAVHELLGGDAGLFGLVLDLLAVLVGAGEEHHVLALEPVIAGDGVRGHSAVGVADVQLVGGIVNGGGDIKLLLFHGDLFPCPLRMEEGHIVSFQYSTGKGNLQEAGENWGEGGIENGELVCGFCGKASCFPGLMEAAIESVGAGLCPRPLSWGRWRPQ